jgi:hypothetical protein
LTGACYTNAILKSFYNYLVATGVSIIYVWGYYRLEMQDLRGHDMGYATLVCFLIGILLLGINCLFFVPRSWVGIRYLLPGILTLSALFIFSINAEFQIKDGFALIYLPFFINALWGWIFYFAEKRQ